MTLRRVNKFITTAGMITKENKETKKLRTGIARRTHKNMCTRVENEQCPKQSDDRFGFAYERDITQYE